MIKKYKNGTLLLAPDKSMHHADGTVNEEFYHDEMFWKDLYIYEIGGVQCLVDYGKQLVYRLGSYLMQNPLKELLESLEKRRYLFPYNPMESSNMIAQLGRELELEYDHVHVE